MKRQFLLRIRRDSVPVVASRGPEQNTSPAPIRERRLSTKTLPSKTRHDRTSSEISTASAQQRGKTVAAPVPETKPRTVEGWMIRDVVGNTVVLQGPGGVWRATQGDTVQASGKWIRSFGGVTGGSSPPPRASFQLNKFGALWSPAVLALDTSRCGAFDVRFGSEADVRALARPPHVGIPANLSVQRVSASANAPYNAQNDQGGFQ